MNNNENIKTAIQNEQQHKEMIMDEIIKILAENNLTILDAKMLLHDTERRIGQQLVTSRGKLN